MTKRIPGHYPFRIANCILLSLIVLTMLFPFYIALISSVATPAAMAEHPIYLVPTVIDFSAYELVFKGTLVGRSFLVSLGVLFVGTSLNLIVTLSAGYSLSQRGLPGGRAITLAFLFTMLFNGGLIPFYLTIKGLRLINTFWVMIFPTAIDTFLLIIAINYFKSVPASLKESARIDGAGEIATFVKIVLPVCMPIVATLLLFYAVQRWNEWWMALIFINDQHLQPLQYIIRQLLIQINSVVNDSAGGSIIDALHNQSSSAVKMATIIISSIPILCLYPFMTKYFNQGIMLGSLKE
jgi:ABC-type sugar transport system, permease component